MLCFRAALAELADANGLPRDAPGGYPDATSVEMFMYNYPEARPRRPAP